MLKKAFKGQIIKSVNISDNNNNGPFISEGKFYLPVIIDAVAASFFNVTNLNVIFTPTGFVSSSSSEDLELDADAFLNISQQQPLHVKPNALNRSVLLDNAIESSSTSNSLFKSLYAKNLVSSKGQSGFLDNLTPVVLDENNKQTNLEILTTTDVNDINLQGSSHYIKVVALNDKNEVVDSVTVSSGQFSQYVDLDRDVEKSREISILRSDLSLFANTVNLSISSYIFPISDPFDDNGANQAGGTKIQYDRDRLRNIFGTYGSDARIFVDCHITSELIENRIFELFRFNFINYINATNAADRNKNLEIIRSEDYFRFISSAYRYCIENRIQRFVVEYNINLSYFSDEENYNITLERLSSISLENLNIAYVDLFKFRFENDLIARRVIIPTFEKLNTQDDSNDIFKITIRLNDNNYNIEDILQNCLSFEFVYADATKENIETFFLDANLTEGNIVTVNTGVPISDYFSQERQISLYFERDPDLEPIDFMFMSVNKFREPQDTFRVGPFLYTLSNQTSSVIDTSIYQSCSNLLSSLVTRKSNISDLDYIRKNLQASGSSNIEDYDFNLSLIDNNQNFKNLGYFAENLNQDSNQNLNSILNNIALKVSKNVLVNGELLGDQSNIVMLNNPVLGLVSQNSGLNNKILNVNKVVEYNVNLDAFSEQSSEALNDYNAFMRNNNQRLTENFRIEYVLSFKFLVFESNTAGKFGNTSSQENNQSKINLIEQIIAYNPSFSVEEINTILDAFYSNDYEDNKQERLSSLYDLLKISNTYDKEFIFSIRRSDILLDEEAAIQRQLETFVNIQHRIAKSFVFTQNIPVNSNIGFYLENNEIVIERLNLRKDTFIELTGEEIKLLSDVYNESNSKSILKSYIKFNIEFDAKKNSLNNEALEKDVFITRANNALYFDLDDTNETLFNKKQARSSINRSIFISFDETSRFEKYTESFYNQILNALVFNNNSTLSGKLVLKIVIVLMIDNVSYTVSKNLYLNPIRERISGRNLLAINEEGSVDLINEESGIFMPTVLYKGIN